MQPLLEEILNHPTDILALLYVSDLRMMACNKSFEKHFDIVGKAVEGRDFFEVINATINSKQKNHLLSMLEDRYFVLDAELLPAHHVFMNKVNSAPEPCILVRVSSITHHLTGEQYNQLFEHNVAGIYKATMSGKIVSNNPSFAKILGYDLGDLQGMNTISLYKNPSERKGFIKELIDKGQVKNYEIEVLRKDRTTAVCLENAYIEKAATGETLVSGILIDITENKRIEKELQDSEQRYRILANVSGESIVFEREGMIIDCNDQFGKLFGYEGVAEVLGQRMSAFFTPQDLRRVNGTIELSEQNRIEVRSFDKNGRAVFLELKGSLLKYKGKDARVLIITDITGRKKTEHALEQSAVRFRNLIENSPNGVVIITEERIRFLNHSACLLIGVDDEDIVFERPFIQFVAKEYKRELKADLEAIRSGGDADYREIKLLSNQERLIDVGIKMTLTIYENNPSIQVTLTNLADRKQLIQEQVRVRLIEEINTVLKTEIEEHKKTQKKLKAQQREADEQRAKLESIINSTENLMMWTIDRKHRVTTMNLNFAKWMKAFYDENLMLGMDIMSLLRKHVDPNFYQGQLTAFDNAFNGRPQQVEFALKDKQGNTVWLQAFLNPVYLDDKLEQVSCLVYDNTERKQIDRMVLDALKEKEILLQEVHHRVKNNLQIISSILNLQSGYVTDAGTLNILRESQERIKSMSYIHETLYRTADFSKLEFTQYINTIVSNLVQSYRSGTLEIELETELDEVYLSLDQSIPCGLIVNELVSNAMKYAWKGRTKGCLRVVLHKESKDRITLVIGDDGVGLPKNFLYEKNDSLGIQLVYTLIEQLDAELDIKTDNKGTIFTIAFKPA